MLKCYKILLGLDLFELFQEADNCWQLPVEEHDKETENLDCMLMIQAICAVIHFYFVKLKLLL